MVSHASSSRGQVLSRREPRCWYFNLQGFRQHSICILYTVHGICICIYIYILIHIWGKSLYEPIYMHFFVCAYVYIEVQVQIYKWYHLEHAQWLRSHPSWHIWLPIFMHWLLLVCSCCCAVCDTERQNFQRTWQRATVQLQPRNNQLGCWSSYHFPNKVSLVWYDSKDLRLSLMDDVATSSVAPELYSRSTIPAYLISNSCNKNLAICNTIYNIDTITIYTFNIYIYIYIIYLYVCVSICLYIYVCVMHYV